MRVDKNKVMQEFISANSKITQSYFAFTDKVLGLVSHSPHQQQILLQLLTQTESVTQKFLQAHQQLLIEGGLQSEIHALPVVEAISPPGRELSLERSSDEAANVEQWLREKLAQMTGFAVSGIDFALEFDQLGLDSLSRQDLQEELVQSFPQFAANISLFEVNTPAQLLASLSPQPVSNDDTVFCAEQAVLDIIARLTGFAPQSIDLSLPFDDLGLDSLGRLDVLETLQHRYPEVKPHTQWLTNLSTPREVITLLEQKLSDDQVETCAPGLEVSLTQLLKKLGSGHDISNETPFAHYLADGFTQGAVWETLAPQYSACQFANEALMSRRNVREAMDLLNRLG
ncbi:phosphopantetheine-binding protein [Serratia sp. (in: enterobacteria)]|uniref:phosphopantetheine-binding protein n=1 Tax=Serratia sp. (in: enterobacteria) TaxID=616 RepID=UPI00398958FF